jgi:hypothetical protein
MNLPYLKEVDLQIDDSPTQLLAFQDSCSHTTLRLGRDLGLLLLNAQEDTGEILEHFSSHYADFFAAKTPRHSSIMIVNTTDAESATSWARLTRAEHVQIHPLGEERKQDIPALVQYFSNELTRTTGERVKAPGAEFITWVSAQTWPYNLTELRIVLMNTLLASKSSDQDFIECAEALKESWEAAQEQNTQSDLINPLTAARTLEKVNGNFRIAAARLGCSPSMLRSIVERPSFSTTNGELTNGDAT